MTNLQVGAELTELAQLEELHVGSIIQSTCPFPSHYIKRTNGRWEDVDSHYEWEAASFTLTGGLNKIEAVVKHVGADPADHHLDTTLRAPEPATLY